MKAPKVLSYSNLPTRPPLLATLVYWLVMDRLDAPPLWRGVVYAFLAFVWIGSVIRMLNEEQTKIWS